MARTAETTRSAPTPFERDAAQVIGKLVIALRDVAERAAATRGETLGRAADLQRTLGIDAKLAWQVFRALRADSPIEAGLALPVAAALRRFLRTAQTRGATAAAVRRATLSVDAFGDFVASHASDREGFDALLAGVLGQPSEAVETSHLEAQFRATTYLVGLSTEVKTTCAVVMPTQRWSTFDMIFLRGYFGLSWQRPNARFALSRLRVRRPGGPEIDNGREPLDVEAEEKFGGSLLPKFCTLPLPDIETTEVEPGHRLVEVVASDVGLRSRRNYVLGDLFRNQRYRGGPRDEIGHRIWVSPPCRTMIYDTLMHASHGSHPIHADIWSGSPGVPSNAPRDVWARCSTLLPVRPVVRYLGRGDAGLDLPDAPDYAESIRWSMRRAGWPMDEFDTYRVSIEYPPYGSVVTITDGGAAEWG